MKANQGKASGTDTPQIKVAMIVYRKDTEGARLLAGEVADWLKDRQVQVYGHPGQDIKPGIPRWPKKSELDLVIVLGGDGTYLEAVRLLDGERVPILGVNMGSLGFLTQVRVEDLFTTLALVLSQQLEKRPRAMLDIRIQTLGNGKTLFQGSALNDMVIERGSLSHLIHLGVFTEGKLVSQIKADGMIIASPTGSTAYNLAAGGPILHPMVQAFVVTPICPHSLTSRPLIFPDNLKLSFRLQNPEQKALLILDGQPGVEIDNLSEIVVSRAQCDHYVLRKPSDNFFTLLREKLRFGERD